MKKNILALVLLSAIATPAMADNAGKVYVAGNLGTASLVNATVTINGIPYTYVNPGTISFAAGYQFSPNIAAEVGYTSFGDTMLTSTTGEVTLSTNSVTLTALAMYPLTADLDLIGKVGMSSNHATQKATGNLYYTDGTQSKSTSQSDMLFGIGAQYHATSHLRLRAQFENFGKFSGGSAPLAITTFSLGIAYLF